MPGAVIPEEYIIAAASKNRDGFGYAYTTKGHTVIVKTLDWTEMAERYYTDVKKHPESTFLMHFRFATNGSVSVKNSHPFPLRQGGALIHNGVLRIHDMPAETSDSRFLARNIIDKLPENWETQGWWRGLLQKYIGAGNKLAMLFDDNRLMIVNEHEGHWKDGVWYSNYTYVPYTPTKLVTASPNTLVAYTPPSSQSRGVIDLGEYMAAVRAAREAETDCNSCETPWYFCDDCGEELFPGEDHECDVPAFVLKQLEDYRKGIEPRSYEIATYGGVD